MGRCADFILQDRTDCLKVFVHADMKFRADRIVRVYGAASHNDAGLFFCQFPDDPVLQLPKPVSYTHLDVYKRQVCSFA